MLRWNAALSCCKIDKSTAYSSTFLKSSRSWLAKGVSIHRGGSDSISIIILYVQQSVINIPLQKSHLGETKCKTNYLELLQISRSCLYSLRDDVGTKLLENLRSEIQFTNMLWKTARSSHRVPARLDLQTWFLYTEDDQAEMKEEMVEGMNPVWGLKKNSAVFTPKYPLSGKHAYPEPTVTSIIVQL